MPKLETLTYIAGVGALIVVGTGHIFRRLIDKKIKETESYQESFNLLKNHPVVKEELGEPIFDTRWKGKYSEFRGEDHFGSWTRIRVVGPKSSGIMKYWTKHNDLNEPLSRLEMKFNHIHGKKLLIKNNENT